MRALRGDSRPAGTGGRSRAIRGLLAATAVASVAACTMVGPDYTPPQTTMPDQWHQDLARGLETEKPDLRTWWTVLDDPLLDTYIERAGKGNLTAQQAVALVQAARANIGIASGEQLPTVNADGSIDYGRISEGTNPVLSQVPSRVDTLYTVGMDASWEVDLWGRIARSVESADANFQASVEDYRDILVTLYAEVAATYVRARTFQARIASALGNVATQRRTLQLVRERRRAGLASDLEVAQAQLNLARTESSVPSLRQGFATSVHALGVLLGERPSLLYAEMSETKPIPDPPKEVLVGVPQDLLRQRPDVRGAERQLAAQTAKIGVATAELYPRFSLLGSFAFTAYGASDWFNGGSLAYGLGPSISWNVFDGGRVRSLIDVEDATTQAQLAVYEQTVLVALRETEDAMVSYVQEWDRRDALARSVTAAQQATKLVQTLYVTGLTDFQNVQDTERNLFQQEDQLAESRGQVALNLIAIYKALGGGWRAEPAAAASATPEKPEAADAAADAAADTAADAKAADAEADAAPAKPAAEPDRRAAGTPPAGGADTGKGAS